MSAKKLRGTIKTLIIFSLFLAIFFAPIMTSNAQTAHQRRNPLPPTPPPPRDQTLDILLLAGGVVIVGGLVWFFVIEPATDPFSEWKLVDSKDGYNVFVPIVNFDADTKTTSVRYKMEF